MSTGELIILSVVAALGHAMALIWYIAYREEWTICQKKIYDVQIGEKQMRRELRNSLHAPVHAVLLGAFLIAGFFSGRGYGAFLGTLVLAFVWAEIWHYVSHRAMHLEVLHWIHAEHHKSHVNGPFSAISFSFSEKLIFDVGYLGALAAIDTFISLNFYGIAVWYIGYLVVNSFGHANFEIRPQNYNAFMGKLLTTTAYHSLHHSRYTGNYGLATRVLDRLFATEWPDYERLYTRVTGEGPPLKNLRERVAETDQQRN
jgi:sterol desaturase/sphingolipid hydroxylase (fatty acid hydroxylase superfamily)